MPDITPFYDPGDDLTGKVTTAAVVGGRFVMLAATKASNDAFPVKYPTSHSVSVLGVAAADGAVGDYVTVFGPGNIVPVEVGTGGVTAGNPIESDAAGKAVASTTGGVVAGLALTTATAGQFAEVRISNGTIAIG